MKEHVLTLDPRVFRTTDDWLDELVGDTVLVSLFDSLDEITRLNLVSLALQQTLDGNLDPVPSLISVHSVVSSHNGRDLSDTLLLDVVLELGNVLGSRLWSGITSITKEVDVDILDTLSLGGLEQRVNVGNVRVDTTVRDETAEVESGPVLLGSLHRLDNEWLLGELVFLDTCQNGVSREPSYKFAVIPCYAH